MDGNAGIEAGKKILPGTGGGAGHDDGIQPGPAGPRGGGGGEIAVQAFALMAGQRVIERRC